MILRIDHVAVAVRDYQKAYDFFTDVLGARPALKAPDERLQFLWHTFSLGDLSRLELVTPTGPRSFLNGFLEEREGGVHHITLQTDDIYKAREELDKRGVPYFGFTEYGTAWKELFIHPRDAFGVLIQIAEFTAEDWLPPEEKIPGDRRWQIIKNDEGITLRLAHPGGGCMDMPMTREDALALSEELAKAGSV